MQHTHEHYYQAKTQMSSKQHDENKKEQFAHCTSFKHGFRMPFM